MRIPTWSLIIKLFIVIVAVTTFINAAAITPLSTVAQIEDFPSAKNLGARSIVKRGCTQSQEAGGELVYICDTAVPEVTELRTKIREHGEVGNKDSLFYAGLPGARAIPIIKQWYCQYVGRRGVVTFDTIVNENWYEAQARAIYSVANGPANVDLFQKRLS